MRDYAERVKALRCCSKIDARNNGCDSCPYEYCGEDCQNLCGNAADAIEELLSAVPKWISVEDAPKDAVPIVGYFGGGDYDQLRWFAFACVMDDGTVLPTQNANEISNEHCIAVYAVPEPPKEVE